MLELHLDIQPAVEIAFRFIHALMPLPDEWDILGYILFFLFLARNKLFVIVSNLFQRY